MAKIRSGTTTDELIIEPLSKAARVVLYDKEGNAVETEIGADGHYYLGATITQNVKISLKNSSTENLLNTSIFIGEGETTLGINGIQVNLFADRILTVYVEQSMDNINWDLSTLPIITSVNVGFSRTILATAAYYRIKVINSSGDDTSVLRLQTCLCPICDGAIDTIKQSINISWEGSPGTEGVESELSQYTLCTVNAVNMPANSYYTVSKGRRFNIIGISLGYAVIVPESGNAVVSFRVRVGAEDSITNASPIVFNYLLYGMSGQAWIPFPEGVEILSDQSVAFTYTTSHKDCMAGMTIMGYEY